MRNIVWRLRGILPGRYAAYLGGRRFCPRQRHAYGCYFDAACGHGLGFDMAANPSKSKRWCRRGAWLSGWGCCHCLAQWLGSLPLLCKTRAYVKALGQVEILASFAISVFVFGEKLRRSEALGILLLSASVVMLILLL